MKVLCTILEEPDFAHYQQDREKLYRKHRENKARESVIYPANSLPIVQVEPQTSRPLSVMHRMFEKEGMINVSQLYESSLLPVGGGNYGKRKSTGTSWMSLFPLWTRRGRGLYRRSGVRVCGEDSEPGSRRRPLSGRVLSGLSGGFPAEGKEYHGPGSVQ